MSLKIVAAFKSFAQSISKNINWSVMFSLVTSLLFMLAGLLGMQVRLDQFQRHQSCLNASSVVEQKNQISMAQTQEAKAVPQKAHNHNIKRCI